MASTDQPLLLYPAATGSGPIVYDAYGKWSTIAQQAFATAEKLAQQVANLPILPVNFNAHFDPQIALSSFPTLSAPTPPAGLTYTPPPLPAAPSFINVPIVPPQAYVSQMFDTLKAAVQNLLGGNPLPASVAAQMRGRAYTEAWAEEQRAVSQAYDEYAARGFYEPGGLLNRRVTEARTDARKKRQQMSRDVFIQEQTVAIENVRMGLTAGVQLEQVSVETYRAQIQFLISSQELEVANARLVIEEWNATVQLYDTRLKGEIARLDETIKIYEAQVEVYKANAQVASAAGEYDNRRFQLNLAQEQAIVDTEMKRQDQNFEQMRYITSVMLEIKKTLATVSAQLASAAMSAVNIGASLSSGTSESVSYALDVNYSGQMADDGT